MGSFMSLSNDYGDCNDNGKNYERKVVGLDLQEHNSARALSFFVHFFTVVARLRQETS